MPNKPLCAKLKLPYIYLIYQVSFHLVPKRVTSDRTAFNFFMSFHPPYHDFSFLSGTMKSTITSLSHGAAQFQLRYTGSSPHHPPLLHWSWTLVKDFSPFVSKINSQIQQVILFSGIPLVNKFSFSYRFLIQQLIPAMKLSCYIIVLVNYSTDDVLWY